MFTAHHLFSHLNSQVVVDIDGKLTMSNNPESKSMPVLLLTSNNGSAMGFMVAPGSPSEILVKGSWIRESVKPWRILHHDGLVSLHEPSSGSALAAREDNSLFLNIEKIPKKKSNIGLLQLFELVPLITEEISNEISHLLREFNDLYPAYFSGPDLLNIMNKQLVKSNAPIISAMIRLLHFDQLNWLGTTILGLPAQLKRFADAFEGDPWTKIALVGLCEWLQHRSKRPFLEVSKSIDQFDAPGSPGSYMSAGHVLNAAARFGVPPRRQICIITTARNEGLYLVEWLAYHKCIGIDGIFVYSNNNTDASDQLLRSLATAGEITWIKNNVKVGTSAQQKALGHAFGFLPDVLDFRWSLVIDIDEFFAFDPSQFASIKDFIDYRELSGDEFVALNWLMFGSGGEVAWDARNVINRFVERSLVMDSHVKCLTRTNMTIHSLPHRPLFDNQRLVVGDRVEMGLARDDVEKNANNNPLAQSAWIAHYHYKSAQEYFWRRSRSRANHSLIEETGTHFFNGKFADNFLRQMESGHMVHDSRTAMCAPKLQDELTRLRTLPGVVGAEKAIIIEYHKEVAELMLKMKDNPRVRHSGTMHERFFRICNSH